MLDISRVDKDKKIMIIGYGPIGEELVKQLREAGYRNIGIVSSKENIKLEGATFYSREKPMVAIIDFQPNLIIDASTTEFTQQILLDMLQNSAIKDLKYVAITPNVSVAKVNTEESVILPNMHIFKSRNIEVIRTDTTNTLFSGMLKEIASALASGDFRNLVVSDEHREEKELFTQGAISTLSKEMDWSTVEQVSVKVNGQSCDLKPANITSSHSFELLVAELRKSQKELKASYNKLKEALITIRLSGNRVVEIKSIRRTKSCDFESKTGYRSINYTSILSSSGEERKFEAKISRQVIASGVLKLYLR